MAQAKTWAAFDVHVSGVVAAVLDRDSGEVRVRRLSASSEEVTAFAAGLPGPVRATYEAGPTGFVLARKLQAAGIGCVVCAPGLIAGGATDRVKTDRRGTRSGWSGCSWPVSCTASRSRASRSQIAAQILTGTHQVAQRLFLRDVQRAAGLAAGDHVDQCELLDAVLRPYRAAVT